MSNVDFKLNEQGYCNFPRSISKADKQLLSSVPRETISLCKCSLIVNCIHSKDEYSWPKHSNYKKNAKCCCFNDLIIVFHEADDGNKGFLTREDVKVAIAEIFGYKPSKLEADQLMGRFGEDINGARCMRLAKYMEAMTEKLAKSDIDQDIRHTFMAFDSHCRGFLTVEDFKKAISQVAPHLPSYTVDLSFRELDRDGDGRVSYKDFEFMMKYNWRNIYEC